MTPAEEIRHHGERLFGTGRGWKTKLARKCGVLPRTVKRWLLGGHKPPETTLRYLRSLK